MLKLFGLAAGALLAAGGFVLTSQDSQAQSASLQRCMNQLEEKHLAWRARNGLDTEGGVSMDQIGEWERICSAQRTRRSTAPQPRRTATQQRTSEAERAAQSVREEAARLSRSGQPPLPATTQIPAGMEDVHRAAAADENLFAHPRVRALYLGLMPMGSSGKPAPIPQGRHNSTAGMEFAMTYVCQPEALHNMAGVACINHSAVIVDLRSGEAAACERHYVAGQGSPKVYWYFKDQPPVEDTDGRWCPQKPDQIAPDMATAWRTAQDVRRRAAIQQPGLLPLPVSPQDGSYRFSGHCNGFTLGGRDYHNPGPCPGGIELVVPTGPSNRPQKSRLTLRVPNPRAPVLVLDLTAASQKYGNNDVIEFEFSPVSALPFSWSAMDGLRCTFVKNPADGMLPQLSRIQLGATLNCGFDESRMANIDKMRFGFFATTADVSAIRAAFIAAHDKLNRGRPFVSPKPDLQTPVTN